VEIQVVLRMIQIQGVHVMQEMVEVVLLWDLVMGVVVVLD
jgi:hypothetical protein